MRRTSLAGPVLLILIGVLFLVRNLKPELVSWELVARYWPVVLIGWGLLRVIEILYWWLTSRPLPPKGLSGGEWVLAMFICLLGAGISAAYRYAPRLPPLVIHGKTVELFGEAYDYPVSAKQAAPGVRRIKIEVPRGNTRVMGSQGSEIELSGRKTIRTFSRTLADRLDRATAVEIQVNGAEAIVRVRSDEPPLSEERSGPVTPPPARISTDLELTVPRQVSLHVSGRHGDFDILHVDGDVEIMSDRAGVRLQEIGGKVRVELRRSDIVRAVQVRGSVTISGRASDVELEEVSGPVEVSGYYSGDLRFRKLAGPLVFQSGNTELRLARLPGQLHLDLGDLNGSGIEGPIRFRARSRDVKLEDFSEELDLSVERGDLELSPGRAPLPRITAVTETGDVELVIPEGARFALEAVAERGEVTNDFGPPLAVSTERRGASLKGATGPGPAISVRTHRGSIWVRKEPAGRPTRPVEQARRLL
ncbi:MAG: DUF5668 domain-containing protein [Bryobacterales bacterium]|nr:DUF5668 domain-containing protein [Bryobacteraceae bacterium]MDW8354684.1 DUF5668 domain-containing protein [Bryobacterales bacterium]